jgi:VWFA-related protein
VKGIAGVLIGAVLAQVPGVEFPSQVELVTIDAVVVDANGAPVLDLARDEFVVKEDGVAQEIVSFERFGADDRPAPGAPPPPEAVAGAGVRPPRPATAFALIVDDQLLSASEAKATRDALARFVSGALADGDAVTIANTAGDAWWTTTMPEGREDLLAVVGRLRGRETEASIAFDYISDYEAFAIHHNRADASMVSRIIQRWTASGACMMVQGRQDPGCPSRVIATAAAVDGLRKKRTLVLMATLRRTLDAFAQRRGRKSILLYSRGFVDDSETTARDVAAAAREANAAVYFIDARGLQTGPGIYGAANPGTPNPSDFVRVSTETGLLDSGGAQALADETGGTSFRNTNDLGAAAARVARESRAYYLLGFQPRADGKADDWHKLKVEVSRPGLTVRTRKGYTLRSSIAEPGDLPTGSTPAAGKARAVMAAALDSAQDADGIPLRARAFVFEPRPKKKTRVLVAAEFDTRNLTFEGSGAGRAARLAFGVAITHRDTGVMQESHEQVEVRVPEGEVPGWRSLAREFDLAAGVSQARVVLRDPRAGAMGAVSHRFEVASPDALRLTTPILTDRVERGKGADDKPRAAIAIDRVFPPRGLLYCEFEVLGAPADPVLRAPRVIAGVEVRAADGRIVRKAEPTPIATDLRGRLVRLIGMGMDGLPEGEYLLVLDVRDEVSGKHLERQEPFALRSGRD